MIKKLAIALLSLAAVAYAADRAKNVYKLSHLSETEVGISCQNGADPTGQKVGNTLIISCGR